ncbi:hypothetical protein BDA96_06G221300 [Sorghum bicolor]|uniref:Uncharacterized protein n=2 Tax=Sorghum bicolor TaxID=4558 RepID=A0A921UD98_SORBI|nr:hypothetical protein BDA96_06G221300 [Sorghum bicolor]OQU82253.1 hypothetical protein SORBI_3006G202401 [Sorghum bicolor]
MSTIRCLQARVIPQPKPANLPRRCFSPPTPPLLAPRRGEAVGLVTGGFWTKWMVESAEARARVAKLGLAAVLAGVGAVRRRHLHDLLRARIPRHTTRAPGANQC